MYKLTVSEEWDSISPKDLWVYNKLQLSQVCGYTCGPVGLEVPSPGFYIVRPSMNFMGMGRYARKEYLYNTTEHLHPGEFWCEIFEGQHKSIDYHWGDCTLVVYGLKSAETYYKWDKWEVINEEIPLSPVLDDLKDKYEWINIEMIGDKLIEVHFRPNADFRYGNTVAIPIWDKVPEVIPKGYRYIDDDDFYRKGFLING
tara:strand:- start:13971 stop:14570 length:600 start_codon:yes stop_codon:yes gene_type:complete